ncbi:hypothetical protein BDB01DRAFT_776563 [Pilobolus umbonatus]|nr:hypothetical protein BDB01DRAFT_776563 [Pilobolus umbonatus]
MITILSAKVRVINFPRSHLIHVTHAIAKMLLFDDSNGDDYFFSFTENEYGISIVANEEVIKSDFLPALEAADCPSLAAPEVIYRVLQVDDEGGQDFSGKRISDISEPLAEGRFSILYISTYQTDFIMVKETALYRVVKALRRGGFEVEEEYSHRMNEGMKEDSSDDKCTFNTSIDPTHYLLDTNVLKNELQCVGLNRHCRSDWVIIVLKILCYPDLVQCCTTHHKRFCSFVATNDDISLIADSQIMGSFDENSLMKNQDTPILRVIQVHFSGSNIERCGIVRCISKPLATEAHINILYLSTFMTANIIVSEDDLQTSLSILAPRQRIFNKSEL